MFHSPKYLSELTLITRQKRSGRSKTISDQTIFSSGTKLSTHITYLESLGVPAILSDGNRNAWVTSIKHEVRRLPMHSTDHVSEALLKRLFKIKGTWVVSNLSVPDKKYQPNCFHYLARGPNYCLDKLSRNTRSKISRGIRHFEVRITSWDEIEGNGFKAFQDTETRHGYGLPSEDAFKKMVKRWRGSDSYQFWGVWKGNDLAAWSEWVLVDDWALIGLTCSQDRYLKRYPNNAMIYLSTWYFINNRRCSYVSYGLSSVQTGSNSLLSLHRFKIQMGYEPIPVHRHFIPKRMYRHFVESRLGSIFWEGLAIVAPRVSVLPKIAGMARLLSGRETIRLAWAERIER